MNIFEILKSFFPIPKVNISTIIKGGVLLLFIGFIIVFLWREQQLKTKIIDLKDQLQILQAKNSKLEANILLLKDKLKNQKFETNISVQKVKTIDKINHIKIQPTIKKIETKDNKNNKTYDKNTSEVKSIKELSPGIYHINIPVN
jgi:cell division protein FtsB